MALLDILQDYDPGNTNLILYGYSWGGDSVAELTGALAEKGIFADLIITVDSADGPLSPRYAAESPVVLGPSTIHKNYYQTVLEPITESGRTAYPRPTINVPIMNTPHGQMFNRTFHPVVGDIMTFLWNNN